MGIRYTVTGGAGFLGINLVRFLLRKGCEVTTLDIAELGDDDVRHRVRHVLGDVRDLAAVDRVTAGADVVVHAAAALPLYSKHDIFTTDVEGTRNVADSSRRHGVERLIHISSTAVYGIPGPDPQVEHSELSSVGHYGAAKLEAERVCRAHREHGMCIPIIRPKSFVGPERLGVFGILFDWARAGKNFPIIGNGRNRYQLLDVDDLCEAIRLCASVDAGTANHTFNIGAAEFGTMREDFQAVLDEAGFGKRIRCLPAAPAVWTLRLLELLHLSPLYGWVFETAGKDSVVSIERAEALLGFSPQYSNRDALIRSFHWYCDTVGAADRTAPGVSHRVPWEQGALKLAKMFF